MSTRGALCLVVDGDEKMIYKHSDAYPAGLGEDVLAWLRDAVVDEPRVRAAVAALRPVPENDPTSEDPDVNRGEGWYSLLRRTQDDIALLLRAGLYEDAGDFPLDSLFCEWAYVVDFDRRRFEVYEGFRKQPPTEGRWVGKSPPAGSVAYWPVQLVQAWSFDELPEPGQVSAVEAES